MFNVGGGEMVVLAILALLVFGPESLPGIIKTVMQTVNAVKTAARDFQTEVHSALEEENRKQDLAKRQRSIPTTETEVPAPAEETGDTGSEPEEEAAEAVPGAETVHVVALDTPVPPQPEDTETSDTETAVESEHAEVAVESEDEPEEEAGESAEIEDDEDGPGKPMSLVPRRVHEDIL